MKCGDLILLKNAVTAHLQKEHTETTEKSNMHIHL